MNNEDIIKSFIEAKNMTLTRGEKIGIRQFLLEVIRENPVRKEVLASLQYQRPIFNLVFRPISLILLGVLSFAGISLAAGNSLPGDFLYPLKVNVNEEVKGLLTLGEEAKVDFEVERLTNRLEEAEKLALAGRLDEETKAKIESDFEKHSEKVDEKIGEFESQENFRVASDLSAGFESALKAHEKALNKIAQEKKEIDSIFAKTKEKAQDVSKSKSESQNKFLEKTKKEGREDFAKEIILNQRSIQAAEEARLTIRLRDRLKLDFDDDDNNGKIFKK